MRFIILFGLLVASLRGQSGVINTVVGAFPNSGTQATNAAISFLGGIAFDNTGQIYFPYSHRIGRIDGGGRLFIAGGTGIYGFGGDGGPASNAQFRIDIGSGIVADVAGNIYFADTNNQRIRRIGNDGIIRTYAGDGVGGFKGDGDVATRASISRPLALAIGNDGALFIADTGNHRIRRVNPNGVISTVAGNGTRGFSGDDGPAVEASLNNPSGIAIAPDGRIVISDSGNRRIRVVETSGVITTIAGTGLEGLPKEGDLASESSLGNTGYVAIDPQGRIVFAETDRNRISMIDRDKRLVTVVGTYPDTTSGNTAAGQPARFTQLYRPFGIAFSPNGDLYFSDSRNQRILRVDSEGIVRHVAGADIFAGAAGPPVYARISSPQSITFDPEGNLHWIDNDNFRVRAAKNGRVVLVGESGDLTDGRLDSDWPAFAPANILGVRFSPQGELHISSGTNQVWKIRRTGGLELVAGSRTGQGGFGGDDGPAVDALLSNVRAMAFGKDGSLYIADAGNHRIRRVGLDGVIKTVVGNGTPGFNGDGALGTDTRINGPGGLAINKDGILYFSDGGNIRIRKMDANGIVTTVAGTGAGGYSGDGFPALQTRLDTPSTLAFDSAGNLFLNSGFAVRRFVEGGTMVTVAGGSVAGLSGDGGPAVAAQLGRLGDIHFAPNGSLYIADSNNDRIRRVDGLASIASDPESVRFSVGLGQTATQVVDLRTLDGQTRSFTASSNASWLQITPVSGTVTATQRAALTFRVDSKGLPKGTYHGRVRIEEAMGGVIEIPVILAISGTAQQLGLSQTGLTFVAVEGGAAPPVKSFNVLNTGSGQLNWTITPSTLSGGAQWLSLDRTSGVSVGGQPAPQMNVQVRPAGLAPGAYYGLATVNSPNAENAPQSVVVLLVVLPKDSPPGPLVEPLGTIVTTAPAGSPPAERLTLVNVTTTPLTWTATSRFLDNRTWFSLSAASGTVAAGQSTPVDVRSNVTGIPAGNYRAEIDFRFSPGNSTVRVTLLLVVATGAQAAGKNAREADALCTAQRLLPVFRAPGANFAVNAGWPIAVEVQAVDDCGQNVVDGTAILTFSTGDPPVALNHSGGGRWTGTWAARTPRVNDYRINLTMRRGALSGSASLTGGVKEDPDRPLISAGGVLSAASFQRGAPVAPGSYVSIFGQKLAKELKIAESSPLPSLLGDTSVTIAGLRLFLYFASDGQVNAIIPYDVPDSTNQQVLVRRGLSYSLPESVLVAPSQPAIFTTSGTGEGQGHVYGFTEEGLPQRADITRPVRAGDTLVFYAAGLGGVDRTMQAGTAAPANPPAMVSGELIVKVNGVPARVLFAGLAPGLVGVYQLNIQVPEGVGSDSAAQLVVSVNGQESKAVSLSVIE